MDGPPDPRARPRERVLELVARSGADEVVSWCADLLAGRAAHDDRDLPSLLWLGGAHAASLLAMDDVEVRVHAYWTRVWAARGLLHVYSSGAAPRLVDALADPAWRVREMAAIHCEVGGRRGGGRARAGRRRRGAAGAGCRRPGTRGGRGG